MKTTNLEEIKEMAILFLYQPIEFNKQFPFLVMHPIFETNLIYSQNQEKDYLTSQKLPKMLNLENEKDQHQAIEETKERINESTALHEVWYIIRKSYRFTFFKYIKDFLSDKDYAELLQDAWTMSENPNNDTNVSLKNAISYFRKAKKDFLMTPDELEVFNNIPKTITIYRGVSKGCVAKGLSWTANKEKAEWFANRFGNGYLLKAEVSKDNILAYLNGRNEDEYVTDIYKINYEEI